MLNIDISHTFLPPTVAKLSTLKNSPVFFWPTLYILQQLQKSRLVKRKLKVLVLIVILVVLVVLVVHRVQKNRTSSVLGITSSNTGRFSKFFQRHNLLEICNKTVIKFPTTPQTHRYTTLWKTDVRKLVNQRDASHHFVAQN